MAVLTTKGHAGCVYEITGPDRYDAAALAALYTRVAARPVQAIALDDAAFIRAVLGPNSTDDHARFGAELVASLGRAIRKGYFAACTNDVERLSGWPARTLQEVVDAGLHPARA
jgi:NAD(P)H dehydrogenase (quinone)